jgi:hypothetical protein
MTKELLAKIKVMEERADKNWLQILRETKTEEELVRAVANYGVTLTKIEVEEAYKMLHMPADELSEYDLSIIAGGRSGIK